MDINKMRNMVIFKDLPSNLIEEAFVVLKDNQKIEKLEYAESTFDKFTEKNSDESADDVVVKEAELLISNYINELENYEYVGIKAEDTLLKKCKYLRISSIILSCLLLITCLYILFIN